MRGIQHHRALCSGAAFMTVLACAAMAEAQPNCPRQTDQLVLVPVGQPVAFSLDVFDLGEGSISIFQYPLGGILQQTGPTEFVFVPQIDFRGTAEMTYRLTPPAGCPRGVILGKVTLAGGNAGSLREGNATTAAGLVEPPVEPGIFELIAAGLISNACGLGFAPMSLLTFAGLVTFRQCRRHARRR